MRPAPILCLIALAALAPAQVIVFKNNERWEVNSPLALDAKGKPAPADPRKAKFNATFDKVERVNRQAGVEIAATRKLEDAVGIEWPPIAQLKPSSSLNVTTSERPPSLYFWIVTPWPPPRPPPARTLGRAPAADFES